MSDTTTEQDTRTEPGWTPVVPEPQPERDGPDEPQVFAGTATEGELPEDAVVADEAQQGDAGEVSVSPGSDTEVGTEVGGVEDPDGDGAVETRASSPAEPPSDSEMAPSASDSELAESPSDSQAAEPSSMNGSRRPAARVAVLEREGEVAADFLERLLDIADLDGDLDVDIDGDRAAVAIVDSEEGRVPRRLVGPDGRVLEALQELTRLAVQTATGERSRLMLDVAGFRAERRAALISLARTVIEQVRASGESTALEDMTAFERKVVHDEVTAAGLRSESEGVEPHRHIVISPA